MIPCTCRDRFVAYDESCVRHAGFVKAERQRHERMVARARAQRRKEIALASAYILGFAAFIAILAFAV